MISCLENYIGLRGACTEVATGGLWINDLPDSGIVKMEALADRDSASFVELWEKVYGRAIDNFSSDIRKILEPKIKTKDILSNVWTGEWDSTPTLVSGAAEYSGVLVTAWGSPFLQIVVNDVYFQLDAQANVTVKVWDAVTGLLLQTTTFTDVPEGISKQSLNFADDLVNSKRKYFIAWNRTAIDSFQVINGLDCEVNCDDCNGYSSVVYASSTAVSPTVPTITTESTGKGMIPVYGLRCSLNTFICENRDVLKVALRLKAYIELSMEMLWNDSLTNKYTLLPAEELQNRITQVEAMYQNELSGVLNSISASSDSICFECNEPVKIKYLMP